MSEFILITGLSGAGRSETAKVLEDLGWFVIDNLPPVLVDKVAELAQAPGSTIDQVALVAGVRADSAELTTALEQLRASADRVRLLFLDAADDALIRRYEDTRRRHPLAGDTGVADAVARERALLEPVKAEADVVIDTTDLNVHQLRDRLVDLFGLGGDGDAMQTTVVSFGYKHGLPLDVDLVIDCRFLPNPHWVDELRAQVGTDADVREYVLGYPQTREFLARLEHLLDLLLPAYLHEGKSYLTIAFGCTGGRHRSVVIAEEVAAVLALRGFSPRVSHRDVQR